MKKPILSISAVFILLSGCGNTPQKEIQVEYTLTNSQLEDLHEREEKLKEELRNKRLFKLKKAKLEQKIKDSVEKQFINTIKRLSKKTTSFDTKLKRDNRNEVVIDSNRDLIWQDDSAVKSLKMNWEDAKTYCTNLIMEGYGDWKLPSKLELLSIVDKDRSNPSIRNGIKNIASDYYWSNIVFTSDNYYAWYVNFEYGNSYFHDKSNLYYVRCVQDSKTLNFHTFIKETYFKKPFQDISNITQKLTDIYLTPTKIKKEQIPQKIVKPSLPILPKLIKDEFETKKMFQYRVNKEIKKREIKIKQLQAQYRKDVEKRNQILRQIQKRYLDKVNIVKEEQKYKKGVIQDKIKQWQKSAFDVVMGGFKLEKRSYDAETATLYATMKAKNANYSKKIALKVPLNMAKNYVANIDKVEVIPKFDFKDNQIVLNSIKTRYNYDTYLAVLSDKDFKPENITVAIKDKKVEFNSAKQLRLNLQNPNLKDTYQIEALAYKDGKKIRGVKYDDDIPALLSKIKSTKIDSKKWLFVVGIENYNETDNIKYANRSAKEFKKVAQKTLGISERHSYTLIDSKATGTAIKNRLRLLLSEVKKGDTIYFYYNGHGIPDPKHGGEPYMLPSDGIPDFIVSEKAFSLKHIYKQLSDSKASKVVAFVDSCFSGATDGVSIIKGVAGSRLAPKKVEFDPKKMVVLTAGQKKQYSNMYAKKGHRLFSYFVMKSLVEGKKDINMLFKEVSYKVSNTSNEFGVLKKQEPTIDGNKKIKL